MSVLFDMIQYEFLSINVSANNTFVQTEKATTNVGMRVDIKEHKEDNSRIMVEMFVSFRNSEGANTPYLGEFGLRGFFKTHEISTNEDKGNVLLNTSAILYGIVRGKMADLTSHFPQGKWIIPTYNFVEHFQKVAENRKGKSEE